MKSIFSLSLESRSYSEYISRVKKLKYPFLIGTVIFSVLLICLFLYFKPSRRPNIILILVDALRADHVGAYGYERNTTPVLDRFARESVLFSRAVSASNWTPVSTASMFSGLYAFSHGLVPPSKDPGPALQMAIRIGEGVEVLAERLKRAGYTTAAVSANSWHKEEFGFSRGFGIFLVDRTAYANDMNRYAFQVVKKIVRKKKPFFLYLHYIDPHTPYNPPHSYEKSFPAPLRDQRYPGDVSSLIDLYDGEIQFVDRMIGEFFKKLKKVGLYEETFIIVTADHGEQFMERGQQGHGEQLFMEEIHIPLIMKSGASPHRAHETVSNIDIYSTILKAARLAIPENTPSIPLQDERGLQKRAGVMSESFQAFHYKSIITVDGKKLIMDFGSPYKPEYLSLPVEKIMAGAKVVGVFDLEKDPLEQTPLNDERLERDLRGRLEKELRRALSLRKPAQKGKISAETLEELKSLGYLK
jgi:arylsulfatase